MTQFNDAGAGSYAVPSFSTGGGTPPVLETDRLIHRDGSRPRAKCFRRRIEKWGRPYSSAGLIGLLA
jgi:hypothetical protein